MKTSLGVIAACLTLVFGVAACGDDEPSSGADASAATDTTTTDAARTQAESQAARRPKRRGKRIRVMDSQFGDVIWDSNRRAIYIFTRENSKRSRCYGACARAWPPVLTRGRPRAGSGVDAELLGTTRRRDGKLQVTYGGQPLYYYVDDPRGRILCHDVVEFGGTWLVVKPDGEAVQ